VAVGSDGIRAVLFGKYEESETKFCTRTYSQDMLTVKRLSEKLNSSFMIPTDAPIYAYK
jgi:hypothetical protein